MKRSILAALVSGQMSLAHAEIALQAGEQRFIFAESDKYHPLAKTVTNYAERHNKGLKQQKKLDQLIVGVMLNSELMGWGPLWWGPFSETVPKAPPSQPNGRPVSNKTAQVGQAPGQS